MASDLPRELVELVIEHLASAPRNDCIQALLACSLVDSGLRVTCQRHIFSEARMWYIPSQERDAPSENATYHRKSSLFVQALIGNPALAPHVRRLDYEVLGAPSNIDNDLGDVLSVMKMMVHVVDLRLGKRRGRGALGLGSRAAEEGQHSPQWKEGLQTFVRGLTLESLSLRGVIGFPTNSLPTSLRILNLEVSSLNFESERLIRGPQHRQIELDTLWCGDIESLFHLDKYFEQGGRAIRLSCIKNLNVWARWEFPELWARLLNQSASLQYLQVTVHRRVDGSRLEGIPLEGFVQSPLYHIPQAAFSTISHLKLDIHALLVPDEPIIRPYTGVVNEGLTQLTALERLEIDIVLEGRRDVEPLHFKANEWRTLPLILQKTGAFPQLRRLSVRVESKFFDPRRRHYVQTDEKRAEIEREVVEKREQAEKLAEVMAENAYPRADFQSLLDLRPGLNVSFVTAVTLGTSVWHRTPSKS